MASLIEQIELQAKLLNYFLGSNKSNINQSIGNLMLIHHWSIMKERKKGMVDLPFIHC